MRARELPNDDDFQGAWALSASASHYLIISLLQLKPFPIVNSLIWYVHLLIAFKYIYWYYILLFKSIFLINFSGTYIDSYIICIRNDRHFSLSHFLSSSQRNISCLVINHMIFSAKYGGLVIANSIPYSNVSFIYLESTTMEI